MRGFFAFLLAVATIGAVAPSAFAEGKLRLAQTSSVTNCMMTCNAQAANCQAACVATPSSSAAATTNATGNTACILNCGTTQLACQTNCGLQSPSR